MSLVLGALNPVRAESSTPKGFIDDYDEALVQAKAENKLILADFSGSDWCFWCQRLDSEIFSKEEFVSAAKDKFVLLMIDQPRDKTILPEAVRKRNREIARRYNVSRYPTVLLLNQDGKIVGETGFVGGGVENYLKHLDEKIAMIPLVVEYLKPLDKRLRDFYKRLSVGVGQDEASALIRFSDELDALIETEAAKTVPEEIAQEYAERLRVARESAGQMRELGLRKREAAFK